VVVMVPYNIEKIKMTLIKIILYINNSPRKKVDGLLAHEVKILIRERFATKQS